MKKIIRRERKKMEDKRGRGGKGKEMFCIYIFRSNDKKEKII